MDCARGKTLNRKTVKSEENRHVSEVCRERWCFRLRRGHRLPRGFLHQKLVESVDHQSAIPQHRCRQSSGSGTRHNLVVVAMQHVEHDASIGLGDRAQGCNGCQPKSHPGNHLVIGRAKTEGSGLSFSAAEEQTELSG